MPRGARFETVQQGINRVTGVGRRGNVTTTSVGRFGDGTNRARRSADVFRTQKPTQRMRTVARRKSLGGSGG